MNPMDNPMGQPSLGNGGGKRPRTQSYNNEVPSGFGSVGPIGPNGNSGQNQFVQEVNGYGGYYQGNPVNPGMHNMGNQAPGYNQNFGNYTPNFVPPNPNFVPPNPLGNPNVANLNPGNQNVNHNVGMGFGGSLNRNFRGRPENYVHGFRGGKRGGTPPVVGRQKVLVKEPATKKVDYLEMIEGLKATAKYDVTDILKSLDITPTEEWIKYLEPFATYLAQKFLIIATRAVKLQPKQAPSQESALFMTDDEFEKFLNEASFRKPNANVKKMEDLPKEQPVDWDKF